MIEYDFGVEVPGWLEMDHLPDGVEVRLGVSEHRSPSLVNSESIAPLKVSRPVPCNGGLRLELNDELYEGVRFGYLFVDSIGAPIPVPNVRLVVRAKQVNYEGSFVARSILESVWYSSAASVRHTLQDAGIGSILLERSDRYAWAGDTYPTVASSIYAFGSNQAAIESLEQLRGVSHGIATYELYWVLSVVKLITLWGPESRSLDLLGDCSALLVGWWNDFDTGRPLFFVGWDERLGGGLESPNLAEGQALARALLVQATTQLALLLGRLHRNDDVIEALARGSLDRLRDYADWNSLGLHARAEAILAGLTELELPFACSEPNLSLSPFSEWPIVRALSATGSAAQALCTVDSIWGGQIRFGASTTMEAFRPAWPTFTAPTGPVPAIAGGTVSFCHPWGSGVLSWLVEDYAGVKLDSVEGIKVCVRAEGSLDGKDYSLTLPTPMGTVTVRFDSTLPAVYVDSDERITVSRCSDQPDSGSVRCHSCGRYRAEGARLRLPALERHAHAPFENALTRELGRTDSFPDGLGEMGHVVLGNTPQRKLAPGWDVRLDERAWIRDLDTNPDDARHVPGFAAGAMSTRSSLWTEFTATIDVICPIGEAARVAFYFVDWSRVGEQFAVDVFDLETGQQLSRTAPMAETREGAVLSWQMDRSIRVRIADIAFRGASLYAIFLDPA